MIHATYARKLGFLFQNRFFFVRRRIDSEGFARDGVFRASYRPHHTECAVWPGVFLAYLVFRHTRPRRPLFELREISRDPLERTRLNTVFETTRNSTKPMTRVAQPGTTLVRRAGARSNNICLCSASKLYRRFTVLNTLWFFLRLKNGRSTTKSRRSLRPFRRRRWPESSFTCNAVYVTIAKHTHTHTSTRYS